MDNPGEISYRRTFIVQASPEVAFKEFTNGRGGWWPHNHNLGKLRCIGIGFDEEVGGEWFEYSLDGSRVKRGNVVAWEPPFRFVVDGSLYGLRKKADEGPRTEIEMRFHPHLEGSTRVELEHRGIHHTDDPTFAAEMFFAPYGWDLVLRDYAAYLATPRWMELDETRAASDFVTEGRLR